MSCRGGRKTVDFISRGVFDTAVQHIFDLRVFCFSVYEVRVLCPPPPEVALGC